MFEDLYYEKSRLGFLQIDAEKLIRIVEESIPENEKYNNLNYKNLKRFMGQVGLIPYDQEIINFLRRVDKDDDGVIEVDELSRFLSAFKCGEINFVMSSRNVTHERMLTISPTRKIAKSSRGI